MRAAAARVLAELGRLYHANGKAELADAAFERGFRRWQEVAQQEHSYAPDYAWHLLTCPQASRRDPARALALMQAPIPATPGWYRKVIVGMALFRLGRRADAEAALQEALADGERPPAAWLVLAMVRGRQAQAEPARAAFVQASRLLAREPLLAQDLQLLHAEANTLLNGSPSSAEAAAAPGR